MKLKIWLNAFIPVVVPNYTVVIPAGTHAGKSGVPLPSAARALNPTKAWNSGFLTDQRSFSDGISASARMRSVAEIDVTTSISLSSTRHESSGTTEVDLESGAGLGFAIADMTRCKFTLVPATTSTASASPFLAAPALPASSPTLTLRLSGAASDPLVRGSADIDYEGTFVVSPTSSGGVSVQFSGKIDAFPAFEAYASYSGVTKKLFTSSPPAGNTVMNLPGLANRSVSGSASFP